jgi:hypothetical protein
MKFGIIKSKIEKCLTNSYLNESFKKDIFIFNELVLKNKTLKEMYYLYDELSSNKGYDEDFANEFISESVKTLKEKSKKLSKSSIDEINLWLSETITDNIYENIDNLVYTNNLQVENKIKSKKVILESLMKSKEQQLDVVKLPVTKVVETANKTLEDYLNTIDETERKEIKKILSEDNNKLSIKYEVLKEGTLDKLNDLKSTSEDVEIASKINQTINKLNNETYNRLNYYKLKELFTNL